MANNKFIRLKLLKWARWLHASACTVSHENFKQILTRTFPDHCKLVMYTPLHLSAAPHIFEASIMMRLIPSLPSLNQIESGDSYFYFSLLISLHSTPKVACSTNPLSRASPTGMHCFTHSRLFHRSFLMPVVLLSSSMISVCGSMR